MILFSFTCRNAIRLSMAFCDIYRCLLNFKYHFNIQIAKCFILHLEWQKNNKKLI